MIPMYYIIPAAIAKKLAIAEYRYGNETDGYLVNCGDLVGYGIEQAIREGARVLTAAEAVKFAHKYI